jgi:rhodanese-related sulfurtransferase
METLLRPLSYLLVATCLAWGACTSSPSTTAVTAVETYGLLRNDFAVLIDLRELPARDAQGAPAPARSVPYSAVQAELPPWKELLETTPKDRQLVFCCGTEAQLQEAARRANAAGFRAGLMGSFDDWKRAALPIQSPRSADPAALQPPTQR